MDSSEIKNQNSPPTRRKFMFGLGIFSLFAAIGGFKAFAFFNKGSVNAGPAGKKNQKVKMLTQDGRLVEIDRELLTSSRRKITDAELQHWIRK